MSRDLTPAIETEIESGQTSPILLVKAEFDSGDVRLHSGLGNLSWNGEAWTGAGQLLTVDEIEEVADAISRGATVQLNGTASMLSLAYNEDYQGRPCTVWLGFLDASHAVIADPFVLFKGFMDVIDDEESGDDVYFQLRVENALVALEKAPERTCTDEDQRELFSDDTFFIQIPDIVNLEVELE